MKKSVTVLVTAIMFMISMNVMSQTVIDKIYEKYAGKEGITSVNISSDMFGLFANIEELEDQEAEEYREAISKLTGLKIVSYEPVGEPDPRIIEDIKSMIPNTSNYKEIMVVNSEDGGVRFVAREENGEMVEMLMVATDKGEITVMSFTGLIDLKTVAKLSQSMGMKEDISVEIGGKEKEDK